MDETLSPFGWCVIGLPVLIFCINLWRFILVAFKVHFLWGVVVILIPPLAIVFIFRHWFECGNFVISCVLSVAGMAIVMAVYPWFEFVVLDWHRSWQINL